MITHYRARLLRLSLLLLAATLFSSSISANEHDYSGAWLHPAIPAPTQIRANQINLGDAFPFTGNNSHGGTETFTGIGTSLKYMDNKRLADLFAGADCGTKIQAADTDLGTAYGVIEFSQACFTGNLVGNTGTSASGFTVSANHEVKMIQPMIANFNGLITLNTNSVLDCLTPQALTGTTNQPSCVITMSNGTNLPVQVRIAGNNAIISDIVLDAGGAGFANPTGGVGVKVDRSTRAVLRHVTIQNAPTHGIWIHCTLGNNESAGAFLENSFITQNHADGIFEDGCGDLGVTSTQIETNGLQNTLVNTTSGATPTITWVSGFKWSSDASLVGTMAVINAATYCQVTAVASITSMTVGNCFPSAPGALSSVSFQDGSGVELFNSPTMRMGGGICDVGTNYGFGVLIWGTNGGGSIQSNREQISQPCQFGNNAYSNIKIFGNDFITPANGQVSAANQISSSFVSGGQSQAEQPTNTWASIDIVDSGQNSITASDIEGGVVGHQYKYGIQFTETGAGRATPNFIAGISNNTTYGTKQINDTTFQGVSGFQFVTNGGGCGSNIDVFDGSGGSNPHKYFRTSGGNLQVLNSACGAAMLNIPDAAQLTFPAVTDTVVGKATTDVLTNKTLNVPLTSGTGLQIFNTTTTCTTGASVGATCTTAAISLPVAEADTSYRVTCVAKPALTAVPVVIATTNSSATQFTITIAALTAVAASAASYDCVAGHN